MPKWLVDMIARQISCDRSEGPARLGQQESLPLIRRVASLLQRQQEWHSACELLVLAGLRGEALDCLAAGGDPTAIVTFASESGCYLHY